MATVNMKGLTAIANRQVGPIVHGILRKKIQSGIDRAQREMLNEFDSHPVTQEISAGPGAENSSGTLGGYGDLYSFIGFEPGMDPVETVRSLLRKSLVIKTIPGNHKSLIQKFIIELPTKDAIFEASPMPWASGRSWVEGIERGIAGFGKYLQKESDASRSGAGIQTKNQIRSGKFENTKYLSSILKQFEVNLKNYIK